MRFREGVSEGDREALVAAGGKRRKGKVRGDSRAERVELREGQDAAAVAEELSRHPAVELAEPNYLIMRAQSAPNDSRFAEQWALRNEGQAGGSVGSDVRSTVAWQETTGARSTVVAVIDGGINFSHPDLVNNQWVNASEVAEDGEDNDGNGFIDDAGGWDWVAGGNVIRDEQGHGTAVAGASVSQSGVGLSPGGERLHPAR